jgi:purine nucleoside permease
MSATLTQRAVKNLDVYGALVFEAGATFKAAATGASENLHAAIVGHNNGQILVNGTAERPVNFTRLDTASGNYYWNGFVLSDNATAIIQYARIK